VFFNPNFSDRCWWFWPKCLYKTLLDRRFILAVFSFIMLTLAERKALREALADDDVPTPGFLFGEINSMATGLIEGGCGWF
jgi:hypothetical protein